MDALRPAVNRAIYLLLTLTVSLTVGCGNKTPKLKPLSQNAVILAFGDSLTFGKGVRPEYSYPAQLSLLTGNKVINAGVTGETSRKGLQRLPKILDLHQPTLMILCHGANDLLRNMDKQKMADNIHAMVLLAQSRGIEVVLIGVPVPRLSFRKTDIVYGKIAKELLLPYEADILTRLESTPALKSDRVHFNIEGYKQMAEAIYKVLERSGAI